MKKRRFYNEGKELQLKIMWRLFGCFLGRRWNCQYPDLSKTSKNPVSASLLSELYTGLSCWCGRSTVCLDASAHEPNTLSRTRLLEPKLLEECTTRFRCKLKGRCLMCREMSKFWALWKYRSHKWYEMSEHKNSLRHELPKFWYLFSLSNHYHHLGTLGDDR